MNSGGNLIGRTFVDFPEDINIQDVIHKLKDITEKKYRSHRKNDFTIKKVKIGEIRDFFGVRGTDAERDFVPIIISLSVSIEEKIPDLNSSLTDIVIKSQKHEVPVYLYFWLFKDKIILSKVSDSRNYLLVILDDVLPSKIEIPYYDVNKLYEDYKGAKNVHAYGFAGRKDSARSGALYFPQGIDDDDVMFKETDTVGKSFVSLTKVLDSIDFTVYGSGAIVIGKDWYSMMEYVDRLMEVRNFLKKYEVH